MGTNQLATLPADEDWSPSKWQTVFAWATHALTASSAVWDLLAVIAISRGQLVEAVWWLALSVAIDSFDGLLARRVDVKKVLPRLDGSLLDNIVDYTTYAFVPAYFMYAGGFMPVGIELIAPALVVVCSAYQFSQTDAKTEDHFFKGFPSYWPVLAFYMLLLDLNPWVNFWVVVLFCVLVFVPIKYIYPSRTPVQPVLMMGWSILWGIVNLTMLWFYPDYPQWMMVFSLSYVVYYYALSFYLQFGPKSSNA